MSLTFEIIEDTKQLIHEYGPFLHQFNQLCELNKQRYQLEQQLNQQSTETVETDEEPSNDKL